MSTPIEETTVITFARDNCCMLVITIPAGSKVLNLIYIYWRTNILLPKILNYILLVKTTIKHTKRNTIT